MNGIIVAMSSNPPVVGPEQIIEDSGHSALFLLGGASATTISRVGIYGTWNDGWEDWKITGKMRHIGNDAELLPIFDCNHVERV